MYWVFRYDSFTFPMVDWECVSCIKIVILIALCMKDVGFAWRSLNCNLVA